MQSLPTTAFMGQIFNITQQERPNPLCLARAMYSFVKGHGFSRANKAAPKGATALPQARAQP
jgi:hypothetical protein